MSKSFSNEDHLDQGNNLDLENNLDRGVQENKGHHRNQEDLVNRENKKDQTNPSKIKMEDVELAIEILDRYQNKLECHQTLCFCASYTVITLLFFTILGLVIERFLPGDLDDKTKYLRVCNVLFYLTDPVPFKKNYDSCYRNSTLIGIYCNVHHCIYRILAVASSQGTGYAMTK